MGERCLPDVLGKPEGKRLLGKCWLRYDIDINMNLQGLGWGACNRWI